MIGAYCFLKIESPAKFKTVWCYKIERTSLKFDVLRAMRKRVTIHVQLPYTC